jgi:hypothetical protein
MSELNTAPRGNSPAFPCQDNQKQIWTGMNLRDYIAMEAMHGLLEYGIFEIGEDHLGVNAKGLAQNSYEIANAMLDERETFR